MNKLILLGLSVIAVLLLSGCSKELSAYEQYENDCIDANLAWMKEGEYCVENHEDNFVDCLFSFEDENPEIKELVYGDRCDDIVMPLLEECKTLDINDDKRSKCSKKALRKGKN